MSCERTYISLYHVIKITTKLRSSYDLFSNDQSENQIRIDIRYVIDIIRAMFFDPFALLCSGIFTIWKISYLIWYAHGYRCSLVWHREISVIICSHFNTRDKKGVNNSNSVNATVKALYHAVIKVFCQHSLLRNYLKYPTCPLTPFYKVHRLLIPTTDYVNALYASTVGIEHQNRLILKTQGEHANTDLKKI